MVADTISQYANVFGLNIKQAYRLTMPYPKIKLNHNLLLTDFNFNNLDAMYSLKELQNLLHISDRQIRRFIKNNELRSFLAEGKRYVLKEDLIDFLNSHQA